MAAIDRWKNIDSFPGGALGPFSGPATHGILITKDDSTDLVNVTRAVYVGQAGNLRVIMLDGSDVTFIGVAAGTMLPIRITRVMSTSTTASSIVCLD